MIHDDLIIRCHKSTWLVNIMICSDVMDEVCNRYIASVALQYFRQRKHDKSDRNTQDYMYSQKCKYGLAVR